jgi:hypothetical protein
MTLTKEDMGLVDTKDEMDTDAIIIWIGTDRFCVGQNIHSIGLEDVNSLETIKPAWKHEAV